MDLQQVVTLGRDALTALAAVGAVVIGGLGLSTWRRQLKGHAEYELARRVLRALYTARDNLFHVRSPDHDGWGDTVSS